MMWTIAPSSMACPSASIRCAAHRIFKLICASAGRSIFGERWSVTPFIDLFNLFNRNNPGANYVTDVAALPVPQNEVQNGNVTDICTNPACTATQPITSLSQLRVAGGALGDFFGPGTTVGIPFAAQMGVRFSF